MRRAAHGAVAATAMALALVAALAGCASGPRTGPATRSSSAPHGTRSATPSAGPTADPLPGMSLEQRVGQLFLVGTPATAANPTTLDDVSRLHAGGIFLSGRSRAGAAATAAVVAQLSAADHDGHPLLVATDQEGGSVQVLAGMGFSTIPSALAQSGVAPTQLQAEAAGWARELRGAGVNLDLAPVADVVASPQQAAANPPIGRLAREYGYGADTVLPHAQAFADGMLAGGVVPVAKHFPGLGAVTANTDFATSVTDTTTDASSPSVHVFGSLAAAGVPAIMVSTAVYARLDPTRPAMFSPAVVTGLLRERLGFQGVVVTDDLSAAAQVRAWSPADRATMAIAAGVDLVLDSADPSVAAQMIQAVTAKARSDPAFAAQVDAACRRVLALKQRYLE